MMLQTLKLGLAALLDDGTFLEVGITAGGPARKPVYVPVVHIDGRPLFRCPNQVVDTLGLLFWSQVPEGFDLLTCTCGVAGCAGFHEEVAVALTELGDGTEVVQWTIPTLGYDRCIDTSHGPGPWVFRFSRAQMEVETDALAGLLVQQEARQGFVAISPVDTSFDPEERQGSVAALFERCRARRSNLTRAANQLLDILGPDLATKCLQIQLGGVAGGADSRAPVVYSMSVARFCKGLLQDAGLGWVLQTPDEFERAHPVLESGAALLRKDLFGALMTLSERERRLAACPIGEAGTERPSFIPLEGLTQGDRERVTVTLCSEC